MLVSKEQKGNTGKARNHISERIADKQKHLPRDGDEHGQRGQLPFPWGMKASSCYE